MPVQNLPLATDTYAQRQSQVRSGAILELRQLWRGMGSDFDSSWRRIVPQILTITDDAQEKLAEGASGYIPAVLSDTGQTEFLDAYGELRPSSLVGVAGDGRPVETLLYGAVTESKNAVASEYAAADIDTAPSGVASRALAQGERWLTLASATLLSDTARSAEVVSMGAHRVGGYVRMLSPPSCSRCAVLAGAYYSMSTAFQRHPRCDCRHIPAGESMAGDMTVDTRSYFDSLSPEQQNAKFTKAGAEAIRNGADPIQVVNARRGMRRAQDGRIARNADGIFTTTEGTTSRGRAFQAMRGGGTAEELAGIATRITRRGPESRVIYRTRARRARLMPESIAEIARSKDEFISLLRMNGYLR